MSILLRSLFDLLRLDGLEGAETEHQGDKIPEPVEMRESSRSEANEEVLLQWIDEGDVERSEPAVVVERSERGVGLRFSIALPVGLSVMVTPHHEGPLKGVIRHSQEHNGGFNLGVRLIGRELRRFDRHPMDAEANLEWSSPREGKQSIAVRVRDSSAEGVQLEASCAIPDETLVRLGHGGWHRLGVISYCKERDGKFVAGVQFTAPPKPDESAEMKD
jgi:hypothetical protein